MKPTQPTPPAEHDPCYPSAVEVELTRRSFLGTTLAGTATVAVGAAAGAALLGAGGLPGAIPTAEAAPARRQPRKGPKHEVRLRFRSRYTFRHSNYQYEQAVVGTDDDRLAAFLGDAKETQALEAALRKILDGVDCTALVNGKRLAVLQRDLAVAVVAHYRRRTRRTARRPSLALFVGVRYYSCRGKCAPPTPYCRPPRPAPRPRR